MLSCAAGLREVVNNMSLQESNFWLTTADMPTGMPATGWPSRVDVAVMGAGITGLSAARALARRGASVALFETHNLGWGASSHNGGMLLPGLKVGVEGLMANCGLERARRLVAASLAAIDCVEQIVREESIQCHFGRCGHLEVAYKPAHFGHFRRSAEWLERGFSYRVRLVTRKDLRREIGSDLYPGGLVAESSAGLNPASYVAGLAHRRAGWCFVVARDARPTSDRERRWLPGAHIARCAGGRQCRGGHQRVHRRGHAAPSASHPADRV
jgi:glycine/D-amino acid oxidase-like deaminating enzyme